MTSPGEAALNPSKEDRLVEKEEERQGETIARDEEGQATAIQQENAVIHQGNQIAQEVAQRFFNYIPDEIALEIIDTMGPADILRLRSVDTRFKDLSDSYVDDKEWLDATSGQTARVGTPAAALTSWQKKDIYPVENTTKTATNYDNTLTQLYHRAANDYSVGAAQIEIQNAITLAVGNAAETFLVKTYIPEAVKNKQLLHEGPNENLVPIDEALVPDEEAAAQVLTRWRAGYIEWKPKN